MIFGIYRVRIYKEMGVTMRESKGLTLLEVIIAIALLGIICVGMLTAMTSQYSLLHRTRSMTESLFEAQQLMEQRIESVKKSVEEGTTPSGTKTAYTLFSGTDERTVFGYVNSVEVPYGTSNMRLDAVAVDMKPLVFDVPQVSNVMIEFYSTSTLPYAYTSTPSMYVKSSFTKVDPQNVFLMGIHRWYVSREGFNTPNIIDPTKKFELEKGTVYPRFPEDYTLITGAIMKDLTTIKSMYAGRHLLYTITPAAKSGKMGATEISNAVFIPGLSVTNNLVLHLDASMISVEDTDVATGSLREVVTNSGGISTSKYFVKHWKDISGKLSTSNARFKAIQSTNSKQPELVQMKMGDLVVSGKEYETYAKFLRFSGAQGMTVDNDNNLDLDNLTIFTVARSTSISKDMTIVSKVRNEQNDMDTWHLGWDMGDETNASVDNQLAFYVRSNNNTRISTAVQGQGIGLDGNWHILTGTSQYNTDTLLSKTTLQIDKNTIVEDQRPFSNSIVNNSPITIGFDGSSKYSTVDIAEIIIYNGVLSNAEIEAIQNYLAKKYQPSPPVVSIYALQGINDTAIVGSSYILPSQLKANMSNSTIQDVDVVWSPNTDTMNTSVAGIYTNVATSVVDPNKKANLRLEVVKISSMDDITRTLLQNTVFDLPLTIPAKLENGIIKEIDVTWDNNIIDTSKIGLITRVATAVLDPTISMTLRIDVIPISVTGVMINNTNLSLNKNKTTTLLATIAPANASNQTIIWSSSDSNIAVVDSTGLVSTKAKKGTARITARTEDGNFEAYCDITVN